MYRDKSSLIFHDPNIPESLKKSLAQAKDFAAYERVIMDVFYQSNFYETTSDNEELRKQGLEATEQNLLKYHCKGMQFVMRRGNLEKGIFQIEKRVRKNGDSKDAPQFQIVSVYYVIDFCIYQASTLSSILLTRLNSSIFYAKKAYEIINPCEIAT